MKTIMFYEAEDGQRFDTREDCERHETAMRQVYLRSLKDEIEYQEVPLFEERKYGAYLVSPVTILTAKPRTMKELEDIAEFMRQEISPEMRAMPGFRYDHKTNRYVYAEPAAFPMIYSVMVERYRKRRHPIVKLFTGKEFAQLANLITGHIPESDVYEGRFEEPQTEDEIAAPIPDKPFVVKGFAGDDTDKPAKREWSPVNVTYNGKTQRLSKWGKEFGIPYATLYSRYKKGACADALFTAKNLR